MKYALVTGAAGGLGSVFVNSLLEKGWTVFALDKRECCFSSPLCLPILADITSIESLEDARETVLSYTDSLDLIVDNAGLQHLDSLVECKAEMLEKLVDVNVKGMMLVNRLFFELIYRARGRIIIISSEIGYHQAQPFHGLYSITKRAVDSYADSLRRELNCIGLKVIKFQPGGFRTGIIDESINSFDSFKNSTKYYSVSLRKLRPFVVKNLAKAKDPETIKPVFLRAVYSPHPRTRYRMNNLFVLKLLDLFGEKGVDLIFRIFLSQR